jgi:hypothetical protein
MSKWSISLGAAVLLNILTPTAAAAQFWDVIRWINDMSGPRMWGVSLDLPVVCNHEGEEGARTLFDCTQFIVDDRGLASGARRTWVAGGRVGYFSNTKAFGEENEENRVVSGWQVGVGVTAPTPLLIADAVRLDVSASADFFKFGGVGVPEDFWVPTITGGIVFRYGGNNRSALFNGPRFFLRYQQFFDTFGGDRFGAPGTFESEKEGIFQFGIGWTIF